MKIGTYRRAKGLEFKQVYLPQYDHALRTTAADGEIAQEYEELARSQLFVAMTRARDRLWLGSVDTGDSAVTP
ncbi:ATP-binding domain-containing protein [Kitasatospora sp. NPDC058965]|uniref:ATP-binding domain-containing protein n=1 Tax=Kitasatospora sp. NPDC058965 TaxID=3346682 RepID=UPI0036A9EB65